MEKQLRLKHILGIHQSGIVWDIVRLSNKESLGSPLYYKKEAR
jgi:hypothetical protein